MIKIQFVRGQGLAGLAACALMLVGVSACGSGSDPTATSSGGSSGGSSAGGSTSSVPSPQTPTVSLTASPGSVSSGSSAMLTWSSDNATSCSASGGWSGSMAMSGSQSTGAIAAAKTYTLTCTGPGGSASQSATVDVSSTTVTAESSCSSTDGGLNLQAKIVRSSGISPLLVFFDATGTTDSTALGGANNTFQDVYYSWNFGDSGVSGTGTWPAGANPGHNSKNTATGGVAAHLYVTNGADSGYTVTVTAYDGTNTASCKLGVTAYDPSGANGFPGSATTCVAAASTPVAGSGGCPAGANVVEQSNLGTALSSYLGNNKRVLFHCGDTFTGGHSIAATAQKMTIGAYGGCENTTTSRPIFSASTITVDGNNSVLTTPADVRITDINFENTGGTGIAINNYNGGEQTQLTLYNLNCTGYSECFFIASATQSGLVASTEVGMNQTQGVYWNYTANQCNASSPAGLQADVLYCGAASYNPANYFPVWYNALIGNSLNGTGSPASSGVGYETFRVSACRMCVFTNNTFENANNVGAVFKFNSANTHNSSATWIGEYAEYNEISDNLFTGTSGTVIAGYASENQTYDERLRYAVIERNYIRGVVASGAGATKFLVGAVNTTVRNNVTYVPSGDTGSVLPSDFNWQISKVAIEPTASAVELYNNTCYALTVQHGCIGFIGGDGTQSPGINSWAQNNLFYNNGTGTAAVTNSGTGNTVSDNSASSALSPGLTNASGSFSLISDFKPTQNYSGAAEVPAWYDALGVVWSPTWSLGAIKP
jgi:hypothetical protein